MPLSNHYSTVNERIKENRKTNMIQKKEIIKRHGGKRVLHKSSSVGDKGSKREVKEPQELAKKSNISGDSENNPPTYENCEMTGEEGHAIFESPLAKQGLHPAYLLGLRPLPWLQQERAMEAQKLQRELFEQQLAFEELQTYGWPGQEIAINPHVTNKFDPPRWPFTPEHTVPGYVFEGAEFHKKPVSSIRSVTKNNKPPSTNAFQFFTSVIRWPLTYILSICGDDDSSRNTK